MDINPCETCPLKQVDDEIERSGVARKVAQLIRGLHTQNEAKSMEYSDIIIGCFSRRTVGKNCDYFQD